MEQFRGNSKRKYSEIDGKPHSKIGGQYKIRYQDVVLAKPKNPLELPNIIQKCTEYLTVSTQAIGMQVSTTWHQILAPKVWKEITIIRGNRHKHKCLSIGAQVVPWRYLEKHQYQVRKIIMNLPWGEHIHVPAS
jgi:hypothetical protein